MKHPALLKARLRPWGRLWVFLAGAGGSLAGLEVGSRLFPWLIPIDSVRLVQGAGAGLFSALVLGWLCGRVLLVGAAGMVAGAGLLPLLFEAATRVHGTTGWRIALVALGWALAWGVATLLLRRTDRQPPCTGEQEGAASLFAEPDSLPGRGEGPGR